MNDTQERALAAGLRRMEARREAGWKLLYLIADRVTGDLEAKFDKGEELALRAQYLPREEIGEAADWILKRWEASSAERSPGDR